MKILATLLCAIHCAELFEKLLYLSDGCDHAGSSIQSSTTSEAGGGEGGQARRQGGFRVAWKPPTLPIT